MLDFLNNEIVASVVKSASRVRIFFMTNREQCTENRDSCAIFDGSVESRQNSTHATTGSSRRSVDHAARRSRWHHPSLTGGD